MSAIGWLIVGLSIAGAALEFVGIVIVAGRVEDLRRWFRRGRIVVYVKLKRAGFDPVARILLNPNKEEERQFADWIQEQKKGQTPPVEPTTYADLQLVNERFARLERVLPEEMREQLKDPWRGLLLLFSGIVLLLVASILGALNA